MTRWDLIEALEGLEAPLTRLAADPSVPQWATETAAGVGNEIGRIVEEMDEEDRTLAAELAAEARAERYPY